ncbi:MAG TPA: hypothetical protein VFV33_09250 [Gemmatimonadaceae bacterium]|nr:hypothetical protein [Gemmatimonadaceae bacterium]
MHATRSLLLLTLVAACGGQASEGADARTTSDAATPATAAAEESPSSLDPEDPCRILARADVERVVGPLRADPWRSGSTCHFAAADGQRLDVDVQYSGANALAELTGVSERIMAKGLIVPTERGLDTLEGRWDDAQWKLGNYLVARQGDRSVTVYMANVLRPSAAAAAPLADLALSRLDAPLAYDGSAHREPPPLVTPVDPCTLLTEADVTAAAGPVAGAPASSDGRECSWPLAPRNGRSRNFWYTVSWTDGIEELNRDLSALGLFKTNLEEPELARARSGAAEDPLAALAKDPDAQKAMGALKGLLGGGKGAGVESLMPKSDPDVPGPWQRGALLAGSDFVVVAKGVRVRAGVGAVGYEATRALMEKLVGRLR